MDQVMSMEVSQDLLKRFPAMLSGYDEEGCHSKILLLLPVCRE